MTFERAYGPARLLGPLLLLFAGGSVRAQSCQMVTDLVSRNATASGNDLSSRPQFSADGRYVVFTSLADDFGPTDTNGLNDIYRVDRTTGIVELVSAAANGVAGNGNSFSASISDDGNLIAFDSGATNFVPGDTNGVGDVFAKNMQTGAIERLSIGLFSAQANGASWGCKISGDGRYVAFQSNGSNFTFFPDTNGVTDVYMRDRVNGTIFLISASFSGSWANDFSYLDDISQDGRWVVFSSFASDIVGLDTNGFQDVFVRDTVNGSTSRVSLGKQILPGLWVEGSGNSNDGSISDDGLLVAFESEAPNLFPNDTNGSPDIFLRDRSSGSTAIMTHGGGAVFTPANSWSYDPCLSGDGSVLLLSSHASNLVDVDVNGAQDIFLVEVQSGVTTLASVDSNGFQGFNGSVAPALSRDGKWMAWQSIWSFGEPNDDNAALDVFVRGEDCTFPETYCTAKTTSNGCIPFVFSVGEANGNLNGGFFIYGENVLNNKPGVLFYGLSGRAALPFQSGTLCVMPPTKRGPITFSGGNPPPDDCSGQFQLNMDAYASGALGGSPLPQLSVIGTVVNAQWWGRDPGYAAPNNTMLTDAIEYTVRP